MAHLAAKAGRAQTVDELYRRAEDVTEGLLVSVPSRRVESSLIATVSNIYLGHFRLAALQLKNIPQAFQILESARGRSIADQLRSGTPPRPSKDRVTEAAREELNRLQIELLHATSPEERSKLLERLFEVEQVLGPAGESRTDLQKAALHAKPAALRDIQDSLSEDEAILEYVLDDPQSFCLSISRHHAEVTALPTSRAQVDKLITACRAEIAKRAMTITSAGQLYSALLQPVPVRLLKPRLIIVPDEELYLITAVPS